MKKIRSLFLASISLAAMLTVSCGDGTFTDWLGGLVQNEISNALNLGNGNLLQNQNGKLGFTSGTGQGIPTGDRTIITKVEIEGGVISGGSTQLTVTSKEKLSVLYLKIDGEDGYYYWDLDDSDLKSSNPYVYQIVLEWNEGLNGGTKDNPREVKFTVSGKTLDGVESKTETIELKTVSASRGTLQISLSWDKDDDMDLHVITPWGEDINYGNTKSSVNGELDVDSNPMCLIDGIRVENVFFTDTPRDGDYQIEARMFKKCPNSGSAGAKYRLTANLNGKFVTFSDKQNGQFGANDSYDKTIEIGTLKIRGGQLAN